MAHNVQVLLSLILLSQIDVSIENSLDTRVQWLHKLLSERRENHAETATAVLGVVKALDVGFLKVLLSQDLTSQKDKAGAFHRHNVGEGLAALGRNVIRPVRSVLREDRWPAGDVDVDVLRVLVVSKECLSVLPAVKACDLSELGFRNISQ